MQPLLDVTGEPPPIVFADCRRVAALGVVMACSCRDYPPRIALLGARRCGSIRQSLTRTDDRSTPPLNSTDRSEKNESVQVQ